MIALLTSCVDWSLDLTGAVPALPDQGCLSAALRGTGWGSPTKLTLNPGDWSLSASGCERSSDSWHTGFSRGEVTGSAIFVKGTKGFSLQLGIYGHGQPTGKEALLWKQRLKDLYAAMNESCGGTWGASRWTACHNVDCAQ
jgi:hypothetical protein